MCLVFFVASFISLAPAASAHHSASDYDLHTLFDLEGTIVRIDWKNPHIYLAIKARGLNNEPREQLVEGGPIETAEITGLTKDTLAVGAHVVVSAHPNRFGAGLVIMGMDVTTDDGRIFPLNAGGRSTQPPVLKRTSARE
jgi:hypothetical protein